jgi:hypothetical protein
MTRTIVRTATLALALAALAAPTALARPDAGMSAAPKHLAGGHHAISHYVTRPVLDRPNNAQPSTPAAQPVTVSVAPADHGIDWTTIAIGIAGSLLAVGAVTTIAHRTRRAHHPRIAA